MKPLTPKEIDKAKPIFSDPVSQCLWDAADYIEKHGWFRCGNNSYSDGGNSACAIVALERASVSAMSEAWNRLARYAGCPSIIQWNDAQESAEQVITALRSCALSSAHNTGA